MLDRMIVGKRWKDRDARSNDENSNAYRATRGTPFPLNRIICLRGIFSEENRSLTERISRGSGSVSLSREKSFPVPFTSRATLHKTIKIPRNHGVSSALLTIGETNPRCGLLRRFHGRYFIVETNFSINERGRGTFAIFPPIEL